MDIIECHICETEGELETVRHIETGLYCVRCPECGQIGDLEESEISAVESWNKVQEER